MGKRSKNSQLTDKQRAFCQEYVKDYNGLQSAIRAGYSRKCAKETASYLLTNHNVKAYIDVILQKAEDDAIMTANEVLKALTASARGQTTEEVVVVEGTGDGCSSAVKVTKTISERDRLKALELLGKRHSLFTDKVSMSGEMVVFNGEDKLED